MLHSSFRVSSTLKPTKPPLSAVGYYGAVCVRATVPKSGACHPWLVLSMVPTVFMEQPRPSILEKEEITNKSGQPKGV